MASLLYKESEEHLDFYGLESVQKLVDYQFKTTKWFLDLMIKFYLCGFLAPFILSISTDALALRFLAYTACLVTQVFFFGFELVQMRQYGREYFTDFWNVVDCSQFAAFIYLFISKMLDQFGSDSFVQMLLSSFIIFLSFYKLMYFARIYDNINALLTMQFAIATELFYFAL